MGAVLFYRRRGFVVFPEVAEELGVRMDAVYILLALMGASASFITFCLMRFPHIRRARFQPAGPFSFLVSFSIAVVIFFVSVLAVYAQAVWH